MGLASLLLKGAAKLAPGAKQGAQLASKIKVAKANKIASTVRKTCSKGKNCSATCIAASKICLVSLSPPVSDASNKMAKFLKSGPTSAAPVKKAPAASAAPVKKAPAASAAPKSSGIANTQKIADDQKLERLTAQWEKSKGQWTDTIGKGDLDATNKAADVWKTAEKEYKDFKKAYDDIYNRPVLKSPKELMAEETKAIRDRVQARINEGFYDNTPKETVARVTAYREKTYENFKKLSDDQLAALGLYGRNQPKYYLDVNKFLRTGSMEGMTPETQQIVQNIVSNMNSALDTLPASLETDLARAVSGPGAKNLQNLKVGDIIEDKGFGSYTTAGKPSTLDQFLRQGEDNAIMEVTSRNARDVSPIMQYQREEEHILRPGTKLRVTGIGGSSFSRKVGYVPTYLFEEI